MQKKTAFFSIRILILSLILVTCVFHISFANEISEQEKVKGLPEGSTLLLRPKVGPVVYEDDIYALYKNNKLYYSLTDVIDVLELAIDFNEQSGNGQGWFLREDWRITFNLNNNQVISRDVTYNLQADNVVKDNDITFISQSALAEILDMAFDADISQQYLKITSPYPLSGVARYYRQTKKSSGNRLENSATLPRKKTEYDWFDINTADVRLGTRYLRRRDGDNTTFGSGTITAEGQALKHEAYGFINADSRNDLTNVIARLSKKDEDAVLLGPLKARSYALGDTDLATIPLTGDSRQELGFHVTNSKLDNTQFQTTDINGNAVPGWDIELYRNGILLSSLTVEGDGYYEFSDVQLFGGDNEFELFFYGPQGEIRGREINVPVTAALIEAQDGVYDISASLTETSTFQKNRTDDVDRETPHFVARYNKAIGNMLTYVGLRNRDIEGDNKTFLGTGFTKLVKNTIIDGNFGVDDEANVASQLTVRKNINNWDLSFRGLAQSDDYIVDESTNPKVLRISGNAQRSFSPFTGSRANVFLGSEFSKTADDRKITDARVGGSIQKGRLNFSNNLFYENSEQLNGTTSKRLDNNFSVRAALGNMFIRGGIDYELEPLSQVDRYFSQINYYPTTRFSTEARLDHEPNRDFTELRLGLNHTNDYFRTSPFIEWDNTGEFLAGVNLNFNLIDTPYESRPLMTSDRSVGRGLVSSFVFHDKNGNNIFDEQDEPLPETIVESINVKRRAETNEKGYSLINNLPTQRATDIKLDHYSLPDPYMIAGTPGVSILPSAGEIVELNFPVHMSGEIDGTVSVRDKKGELEPLKRAKLLLYPLSQDNNKTIEVDAAFDGFYVASQIPPGQYVMTVSNETARRAKASLPVPQLINIGYNGEVLYGLNFELDQTTVNIPVNVAYNTNVSHDVSYFLKVSPQPETKLLDLLNQLKNKNIKNELYADLEEVLVNDDGKKIYKLPSNDLKSSHSKCEELAKNAVPCALQIYVPTHKNVQEARADS